MSNSGKFTHHGHITLTVNIVDNQWIQFSVADTGIGISESQLKRLFQPFMQADASTTRQYGGTGLGLAITHRFCQMMGGLIQAESEPDKGSTFIVHLPYNQFAINA